MPKPRLSACAPAVAEEARDILARIGVVGERKTDYRDGRTHVRFAEKTPEERARLEQEEADRKAEEERIAELRARCEKEGLDFETENQRYLEAQEKRKNSLLGKLLG